MIFSASDLRKMILPVAERKIKLTVKSAQEIATELLWDNEIKLLSDLQALEKELNDAISFVISSQSLVLSQMKEQSSLDNGKEEKV